MKSETAAPETKETISSLNEVNLGKRIVAAFLDFILGLFIWLFFSMIVMTPIANAGLGYSDIQQLGYTYQTSSHLWVYEQQKDDGNYEIIEVKDYTEKINSSKQSYITSLVNKTDLTLNYYLTHVYYYYTSFLTGKNVEMPNDSQSHTYDMEKDHFVSPDYKVNVKGTELLPENYYTTKYFNEVILKIGGDGDKYFSTPDINVLATIKEGVNEADCRLYLRNLVNNAQADIYYRDYYQNIVNNVKGIQIFIIIPPYVLAIGVIYFLAPLLSKNGQTFAKRFCHIALVSKDGYKVKKRQVFFREFVFVICITLSLFIVGIGLTSFATFGAGMFILLIATLISKTHRAPHDYAALTYTIDANKSVWFDSKEDELAHAKDIEEKMNRYKSVKVENKNIIQIGDKIIDEKVKDEVEKAKKASTKEKNTSNDADEDH